MECAASFLAVWYTYNMHKEDTLYQCPECGMKYKDKSIADRCEAWCKEHHSCNLDIIKYAVSE
jgi:hypothetical protein